MDYFVKQWLLAFALTQAVEVPIYCFLLRLPWRQRLFAAVGASALTHPYVWFVLPPLLVQRVGFWGYAAIAEIGVTLVEAGVFLCFDVPPRRALITAVVGNAASFGLGLLLFR